MNRSRYLHLHDPYPEDQNPRDAELPGSGTDFPDLLDKKWNGFRVGSESCHLLLPDKGTIESLSERIDPAVLTLVTPLAGPGADDHVIQAVHTASALGWGEIVANDWGILEALDGSDVSIITAGRLLMRLRRGPGEVDRWDEQDEATRRYFAWGPLYDSAFLDFLHRMGVDRLELDPPRHWLPLPETSRFDLSFHIADRFITLSATCPWLYDAKSGSWKEGKICRRQCCSGEDISMASPGLDRPLILRNKAVLEPVEYRVDEADLPGSVDRLIYSC